MAANPRSNLTQDANRDELRRVLGLLIDPDACHEVRSLPSARSRLIRGSDLDAGVLAVCELIDDNGIYITLNPVRPDLGNKAASDSDVLRRRHFLLDFDRGAAIKKRAGSDSNATEGEKEAIKVVADLVLQDLTSLGWPRPLMLDSGNGWHLVYSIDLPNDAASAALLKNCLAAIQAGYGNDVAEIDTAVANASRITKLPGTWVRKGPHSASRPHRLARLVSVPTAFTAVPIEKLLQVAALVVEPEPAPAPTDHWLLPAISNDLPRHNYARAALAAECREVAVEPEGNRNKRLNLAAFRIGQLLHLGLDRLEAQSCLEMAAHQSGLGKLGATKTILSGFKGGQKHPRDPQNYPDYGPNGPGEANFPKFPFFPGVGSNQVQEEPWEPPLFDPIPPAEPFPLDILPESLAELCRTAAAAIQCPVDYFATAAIGMVGGVVGRTVALKMSATWDVAPNLFVALVGDPGSKKSPALKLMAGPLYAIDRRLREEHKAEKAVWKQLGDKDPDEAPVMGHLTLDDTTREAFGKILNDNPRGLVLIKDELTAWVADLDAYRNGKGSDRQFWMSVNTGSLVKITRKGSPEPLIIVHPCASVVGCLTPSALPQVRSGQGDDGWFDRLVFSMPDPAHREEEWTRRDVPTELLDDWRHAIDYLWSRSMVKDEDSSHPRPFFVRLDDNAEAQWAIFYRDHQREQKDHDFPRSLVGPWSKYEGYALRLALILSQLHQAYELEQDARPTDIQGIHMAGAALLVRYFKSHFRRVRIELCGSIGALGRDAAGILDWVKAEKLTEFSLTDLRRKFRRFTDHDRDAAIEQLTRCRVIRFGQSSRASSTPGRMKTTYLVNPFINEDA